ncbi:DNA mismatch repair protein MSH5 [Astathelohania contejeani]|uniref:DNA mismatch repair protein MSH5 n=1 Tax=Astathelohania contejeani TaxID=164912 RepID=A0ABQ7HYK0_9MICR|nr:DNA mismatch repair protein MSH5 [Thelohania contejeani]
MKIAQENKNILAVEYQKSYINMCIYLHSTNQFVLLREIYDPMDCSITKSSIYKFDINVCIFSRDMPLARYDCLVETGVEMRLVERSYFARGWSHPCLNASYIGAGKCFRAILKDSLLDWSHITQHFSGKTIGTLGKYKIVTMDLGDYLHLNYDAIKSMNLVSETRHPNPNIKGKSIGNSLFDIINYTQTFEGSKLLKNWLLFPLNKCELIKKRRNVIKYILDEKLTSKLTLHLKKCKNLNHDNFYKKDKKYYFRCIYDFLNGVCELSKVINIKMVDDQLHTIIDCIELIQQVIDFNHESIIIKESVNDVLDHLKKIYELLPSTLNTIGERIAREYNKSLSIIYFPQVGYLIEVDENDKLTNDNTIFEENYNLIMKFKLNGFIYYKNELMEDLDDKLGDIQNRIRDIEIEITNDLKRNIDMLDFDRISEYISIVDCYNSLAIAALKLELLPAELGNNSIKLKRVRNILFQEKKSEVDLEITNSVIVTGPNGSGKSSLLKLIGSLIILNQMGSYLPIESGELKVFDKMFTRISNIESISQEKSAFISDLYQLQEMFHFSTPDSLVLIDELGKGTNIVDGVALYLASLRRLKNCLVISVTHYQAFISGLIEENADNTGERCIIENLTYTLKMLDGVSYNIKDGMCHNSKGLELVNILQFPKGFYEKCIAIKDKLEKGEIVIKEDNNKWAIEKINEII